MALIIGLVQGGIQSLSRSLFGRLVPVGKAGEFFGFYNLMGKAAAILGPTLTGVVALLTHDSRLAIVSIVILFVIGAVFLIRVGELDGRACGARGRARLMFRLLTRCANSCTARTEGSVVESWLPGPKRSSAYRVSSSRTGPARSGRAARRGNRRECERALVRFALHARACQFRAELLIRPTETVWPHSRSAATEPPRDPKQPPDEAGGEPPAQIAQVGRVEA